MAIIPLSYGAVHPEVHPILHPVVQQTRSGDAILHVVLVTCPGESATSSSCFAYLQCLTPLVAAMCMTPAL